MLGSRKARRGTFVISALVTLAAIVPLSNVFGSSLVQNTNSGLTDAGNIHLHFDGTGASFAHYPTGSSTADNTQAFPAFSTGNCPQTTSPLAGGIGVLTAGSPSGTPTLSYATNPNKAPIGIGVMSNVGGNSGCGRIDWANNKSETLTFGLGTAYSGAIITSATLIFDAKYSAVINVALLRGGSQVGTTESFATTSQSDSGPDCASCDHWYSMSIPGSANVGVSFNGIKISVSPPPGGSQAAASLAGGFGVSASTLGHVTAGQDSVFNLSYSDGVLNCNQTVHNVADGTDLLRGPNKDASTCTLVNYDVNLTTVDSDTEQLELLWDTTSQPTATFKITKTWDAEPNTDTITNPTVNYGTDDHTALWCTGTSFGPIGSVVSDSGSVIRVAETDPTTTPQTPFDIVIGSERLTVTARTLFSVFTYDYTVSRGVGNTAISTHDANAVVSTTIFPVVGTGSSAYVEVMCLAKATAVAVSPTQFQVTDEIWVEGDALVKYK